MPSRNARFAVRAPLIGAMIGSAILVSASIAISATGRHPRLSGWMAGILLGGLIGWYIGMIVVALSRGEIMPRSAVRPPLVGALIGSSTMSIPHIALFVLGRHPSRPEPWGWCAESVLSGVMAGICTGGPIGWFIGMIVVAIRGGFKDSPTTRGSQRKELHSAEPNSRSRSG